MRERLRRWWSEISPAERWRREQATRDALLASIDLETADRVASFLFDVLPANTPIDTSSVDAIERYVRGFLLRAGDRQLDDVIDLPRAPVATDDERFVVAYVDFDEAVARLGDIQVYWPKGTARAQPIAHLVIDVSLSGEELAALAADRTWTPKRAEHAPPVVRAAPDPPLLLRSRARWFDLVFALITLPPSAALVALCATLLVRAHMWSMLLLALLPVLFSYLAAAALVEILWSEPRARRLAIDATGLTHPRTGARIAWERLRAVDRRGRGLTLTLPDGARAFVPDSLFVDARSAERPLRARVAKPRGGPYRHE